MNRWQQIAVAALAAALFSGGWWTGAQRERSAWQTEKLAMSAERDRKIDAARQVESRLRAQVMETQEDARKREETLVAAAAGRAADGLREIASLRHGLSAATAEANRYTADSALDVFGECVERYRAVAQAADGHANDVMTLDQAWPVSD
ncbi:hypothetical protein [Laribacter hongkongensis]|uniref:hypothetical protein n=1 Tax=Laribacter hongkongensis TaxID=168471 RepID=UPI001EFED8BC|nr:hypothetical protein [Laribacter hongkongensis]MCG9032640.1 hypothetical protein [Laribacter hongkongensis]MCG9091582.1 hypothetical protein [Laribacter hongkongensis]